MPSWVAAWEGEGCGRRRVGHTSATSKKPSCLRYGRGSHGAAFASTKPQLWILPRAGGWSTIDNLDRADDAAAGHILIARKLYTGEGGRTFEQIGQDADAVLKREFLPACTRIRPRSRVDTVLNILVAVND